MPLVLSQTHCPVLVAGLALQGTLSRLSATPYRGAEADCPQHHHSQCQPVSLPGRAHWHVGPSGTGTPGTIGQAEPGAQGWGCRPRPQGLSNQGVRGDFCCGGRFLLRKLVGRDICCCSTRSQGGITFQWRWERCSVQHCIVHHLPHWDAWPPCTATACIPTMPKSFLPLHLSFLRHRIPLSLSQAGGQHPADTLVGSQGCPGQGSRCCHKALQGWP